MARPDKAAAVAELTDQFRELQRRRADRVPRPHRGAAQELRRALGGHATYAVVKNTLTKIAARDAGVTASTSCSPGPSAIAFVTGDPVEAAKGLRDFARRTPRWSSRAASSTARPLTADEVRKLADLESREVLLAKLAGAMKASLTRPPYLFTAPLSQAARTVDALAPEASRTALAGSAGAAGARPSETASAAAASGAPTTPARRGLTPRPAAERAAPAPAPARSYDTEKEPPPWRSSAPTSCSTRSRS